MIWDAIIIGSGPAGAAAALRLAGHCKVLVLDVGHRPLERGDALDASQYELKRSGRADPALLIGKRGEALHNIHQDYLSPKLKAPLMRFVSAGWQELSPIVGEGFSPVVSHARGGLANAWGAGAYRFTAGELRRFPLTLAELEPWYRKVEDHIGVSGAADGFDGWLGASDGLLPPPALSRLGTAALRAYEDRRAAFNRRGFRIGRQRLALLTRQHGDRAAYRGDGTEFFRPENEGIYNPWFTMRALIAVGTITYRDQVLIESYTTEGPTGDVIVRGRDLTGAGAITERCRRLILAAGAINSSRIVLTSHRDDAVRLPLRDNQISYVPMVRLRAIGEAVEPHSTPAQLVVLYEGPLSPEPVQASFYGMTAPLWNDYAFSFPLAARGTMAAVRHIMPAMAIVQLFYADCGPPSGWMSLSPDRSLRAAMGHTTRGQIERELIKAFLPSGFVGHPALCQYPAAGNSFHYAGMLPMTQQPSRFQCSPAGELGGDARIIAADAASFTELPSKNLTLTIMANAMRVADHALSTLTM